MVGGPNRRARGGIRRHLCRRLGAAGYSNEPTVALAGFERALTDAHAATQWLLDRPEVDRRRVVVVGHSRGGILAVAWMSRHPIIAKAAINSSGGWLGKHFDAFFVNQHIWTEAGSAHGPASLWILWIYGENDSYYAVSCSRYQFENYRHAGGIGEFYSFDRGSGKTTTS
jgi:dienelactone hydrolase